LHGADGSFDNLPGVGYGFRTRLSVVVDKVASGSTAAVSYIIYIYIYTYIYILHTLTHLHTYRERERKLERDLPKTTTQNMALLALQSAALPLMGAWLVAR
jgi:hypothetical protein